MPFKPLTMSHWPAEAASEIRETTVGGVLREAAAECRDAIAVVEAKPDGTTARAWTYAELLAHAERLAGALGTRFAPGERIAVWSPNSPEWIVLEFAAGLAGLALVTVNPAYQAKELKYVLEQSRSAGLFLVESFRGNPMAEIARKVVPGIAAIREITDMNDAVALYRVAGKPAALPDVRPGDAVQIQYTSGTTGFPKGAVLHHRGITNNARLFYERVGGRVGDTLINFMPLFHTAGCVLSVLGVLQGRGRIVTLPAYDPTAVNALVESERADLVFGVPTTLIGMLQAYGERPRDFSSLRMVVSGGSMVPPELVRRVRETWGCEFETVYGQTETSPIITQTCADDAFDDICETIGRPLPCTEVSIRSPADNTVVPVDTIGEICSRGYLNMIGYNDNPEATAKTIDAEGWLHTGDLGQMDERGFCRISGRVKEMIIRGGENLFPVEIENVLIEHPGVAEVAVVGLPDEKWGEIAAAFVRASANPPPSVEALRAHCRAEIAPHKTPSVWVFVESYPLTGSGKVQKHVLRERYLKGEYDSR